MRRSTRVLPPPVAPRSVTAVISKGCTLSLSYEQKQWDRLGRDAVIVGLDEAGRGPLAGPVVAAAVAILDAPSGEIDAIIEGVRDSKLIVDEEERERLHDSIVTNKRLVVGVATLDQNIIDEVNILRAAMRAMDEALNDLTKKLPTGRYPTFAYIDGPIVPSGIESAVRAGVIRGGCEAVIRGDGKVYSIAAASIVAKVTRDRIMRSIAHQYPQYGFDVHKGYGTPAHMAAIAQHGPTPIHRRTFNPVKAMLANTAANTATVNAEKMDMGVLAGKKAAESTRRRSVAPRAERDTKLSVPQAARTRSAALPEAGSPASEVIRARRKK